MPQISVIVPIYNVAKYIEKCVCSLMEQTLDDIEYIFVNDCTPDNSIEILQKTLDRYPNRKVSCKIIHHEINKGLTSTRNTGLAIATGEYIAHCDSDDWVEKTMYEELYYKAKKENADVVYSNINMVFPHSSQIHNAANFSKDKTILMKNYISSIWSVLWNFIAKRELYEINNLKSPTHLCYCEDFWLSVRLFHFANKIEYINKAFYNYNRLNKGSITHNLNNRTEKQEQTAYLETIEFFKEQGLLEEYEQELSWRILKSKQELVLDSSRHKEFLEMFPTSHKYIWTCPYINKKLKIMMWMLSNNMSPLLNLIIKTRTLLGR